MHQEKRGREFYILAFFFALFVLFLYGPLSAILILAFQGPNGGLTFPLNGVSLHWFGNLFEQQAVGDFGGSFRRSFGLGLMVMIVTVFVSLLAGLAFRRKFIGATPLFISPLPAWWFRQSSFRLALVFFSTAWAGAFMVYISFWRASHLDAAIWRAHHAGRVQPLLAIL